MSHILDGFLKIGKVPTGLDTSDHDLFPFEESDLNEIATPTTVPDERIPCGAAK